MDPSNIQSRCYTFACASLSGGRIMSATRQFRHLFVASAIVLAWAASAIAADPFTLTSTTFKDGQLMPKKAANTSPTNANCVGENVSPQLSWTGVPDGTRSFAILMEDPEGRGGRASITGSRTGFPPQSPASPKERSASPRTSMSAERAHRASGTTPDPARLPARPTTTRSSSSPPTSTRRNCLLG